jgi:peptide chain release factor 2
VEKKRELLQMSERESASEGFWDDPEAAKQVLQRAEELRKIVDRFDQFATGVADIRELAEMAESEEEHTQIERDISKLELDSEAFERLTLFSGEYDEYDVFLTIQSGAGGADAQDWARMLLRMYVRWCERCGFSAVVVDESEGAEGGIKSATLEIHGLYAYGNLKNETGTHRLVRLSPFNADQLRQTSFARVEVLPILKHSSEVSIDASDLRIDTYRASGAGGQHVNKTDSAVRITHVPTGLVSACQSERSQAQNKERAMAMLLAKWKQKELDEQRQKTQSLRGKNLSAEWGSQIRSYVMHPYTLVKDHRTGEETPQVREVLDGDIDRFLRAALVWQSSSK